MASTVTPNFDLNALFKRGEIAFSLGLISILVILILPLPHWLLDTGLAISITFSLLVLMTSLFIEKPLQFSSFPTVLLVATMMRLSLNVASTRLILSHGHEGTSAAGKVIQAFGNYVMGGNFVIGIIVFVILMVVNFVVITKGSGRIAEVSARFSLDAMPGKQMAVDADLSAGLINEQQAKDRRKELEDESNFYGAMDGAAKFVRGDAIAGLIITFINVIGGVIIGMVQKNLSIADAAHTYTILTVGDGLVTQIPALIVSTAAGMLVSKSGAEGSVDKALFGQIAAHPSAIALSSALMAFMGLLPGLPVIPFFGLSALTGLIAYNMSIKQRQLLFAKAEEERNTEAQKQAKATDPTARALKMDIIRLELGYNLLPLIRDTQEHNLPDQIKNLRAQLASEIGFILPSVRIQDNMKLPTNTYTIYIKEIEAARGEVFTNQIMVMNPDGGTIDIPGNETKEPTFGLAAKWISPHLKGEAERKDYTVVAPSTVITTHITETIKDNLVELLTFTEAQKLLDELDDAHKKLLKDIVPSQISMAGIQRVLQNLLDERVSIRDLPTIIEAVAEASAYHKDIIAITEHIRTRLARQICADNSDENGILPMITLSPEWEHAFIESIVSDGDGKQLAMAPTKLQEFIQKVSQAYESHITKTVEPVLLVNPATRTFVRSVIERFRPQTTVLSQNEVHPKIRILTYDQIT